MVKYLFTLCLIGCSNVPIVSAPIVVQISPVNGTTSSEDIGYIPEVKWNGLFIPNDKTIPASDIDFNNGVFSFGGYNSIISLDNNAVRLDCSNGATGIFHCGNDAAIIHTTCERMSFTFKCRKN
jgi:hypothetical protein